jgi:methionine-rich copper-binding protein CopC
MRLRTLMGVICAALPLSGCPQPSDTTPPTITSSAPTDGSSGVVTSANLAISFSEAMNPDSVIVRLEPTTDLRAPVWNASSLVVFDPAGLAPGSSYTVFVEGEDLAGNALQGAKSFSFQTLAASDISPPTTPSGIVATAEDGAARLEWRANAEPDLGGYTVFFGRDAANLESAQNVDKPGVTARLGGLENGVTYFFAVDAYDASGNHSARSTVGSVTPKDSSAPVLTASEPSNGSQDLALVPVLRFTFSEPMNPASLEIGVCLGDDPPANATCANPSLVNFGAPAWSAGDTVVQFAPTTQIQPGKTHVLALTGKDKAGNALRPQTRVAFSMRAIPDTTAPTVIGEGYRILGSPPRLQFDLLFSEPMDRASAESAFLSQPPLDCTWTWVGDKATCQMTTTLRQHTTYKVTLGTGARDLVGNTIAAPYQTLAIVGNLRPRVIASTPSDGATNVSRFATITLTFSEPMDPNVSSTPIQVYIGNVLVPGRRTWNADSTQLTFTPNNPFTFNSTVKWEIAAPAADPEGGLLASAAGSFGIEIGFEPARGTP